ncbi:MAG: hypothetical protein R6U40_07715, partial [Desulfobacterales bacterium]
MPEYVPPRNDNTRLGFLRRAVYTAKQDHMLGNQYLSDMLVQAIEAFIPQFEKRLQSINSYLSRRSSEISESTETFRTLMIYIRDMWNVLKRRVRRLNQPASVLNFYGLPQNGHAPNPTSKDMWFVLADNLIKGDELAVKAGKINEYGIYEGEKWKAGRTEEEMYQQIGLSYIEPELRENRGEV